jgi:hypothetical protein
MASQSKGIAMLTILSTALIALVASYILIDKHDPTSRLYCVHTDSPFSITTLNGSLPQAKCFRVEKGIFTDVLAEEPVLNNGEKISFLDGHVLPGIIESHGHILQYGEMLESVSLYGAESVVEIIARIKDFLKAHRGEGYGTRDKWIRGVGWDQAYFGGVMPTAVGFHAPIPMRQMNIELTHV